MTSTMQTSAGIAGKMAYMPPESFSGSANRLIRKLEMYGASGC